jgi:hypothetical protein
VSNFQGASEPAGEEFIDHIVGKLNEQRCLLDVVSIDVPDAGADADAQQTKNVNSDTLAQVLLCCLQTSKHGAQVQTGAAMYHAQMLHACMRRHASVLFPAEERPGS